jgi:hypothetical protein
MRGNSLGMFERSAIEQTCRDARGPEGVAIRGRAQLRLPAAPLDHPEHILPAHTLVAEAPLLGHAPPQGRAFSLRDPGTPEIGVEIFLGLVMDRYLDACRLFRAAISTTSCPVDS